MGVGVGASGVGTGVGSGVGAGVGVVVGGGVEPGTDSDAGVGVGAELTSNRFAMGSPQPALLHACTRTIHSPESATVMFALEAVSLTPSFSLLPGPATRHRTQYWAAPDTSSQPTDTPSEPGSVSTCSPVGLPGTLTPCEGVGSGVGMAVGVGPGPGVDSGVGAGVGVGAGAGIGAKPTSNRVEMGSPQPALLHACTRTIHSPESATVIFVPEDCTFTPSFSLLPGPATRHRTQY